MSIVITGATGQLGRLAIENLLQAGTPAESIVATGRDESKLAAIADELGVQARRADLSDPQTLASAFSGIEKLLLVSTTDMGLRLANHKRAIDAARDAGARLIVYTSPLNASSATMLLAEEHRATEEYLRAGGVPFVILRNGWYIENYTGQLPTILEHGALVGAAGDGRVSAAARRDLAAAAATVLTDDGHAGSTYELGGEAFTLTELAAAISRLGGVEVSYRDLGVEEYAAALTAAGLPPEEASVVADADAGLRRGELYTDRHDLEDLLGHPPATIADVLGEALATAPR